MGEGHKIWKRSLKEETQVKESRGAEEERKEDTAIMVAIMNSTVYLSLINRHPVTACVTWMLGLRSAVMRINLVPPIASRRHSTVQLQISVAQSSKY